MMAVYRDAPDINFLNSAGVTQSQIWSVLGPDLRENDFRNITGVLQSKSNNTTLTKMYTNGKVSMNILYSVNICVSLADVPSVSPHLQSGTNYLLVSGIPTLYIHSNTV